MIRCQSARKVGRFLKRIRLSTSQPIALNKLNSYEAPKLRETVCNDNNVYSSGFADESDVCEKCLLHERLALLRD